MTTLPANALIASPASLNLAITTGRGQATQQAASTPSATAQPAAATPSTSTVLHISSVQPSSAVYRVPPFSGSAWAADPKDAISTQMSSNSSQSSLSGQWNKLGGMLLSHLSGSGTGYRQTLLPYPNGTQNLDMQLNGVRSGSQTTTASLEITTRSGQKVQLQIAVSRGNGLHVEIESSGSLSDAERKALAALTEGLDRALAGLGKEGSPQIDLSGLMDYDRKALASLNLSINVPEGSNTSLQALRLNLNDKSQSLDLKTNTGGEVSIRLDPSSALASSNPTHKQAALSQHLQQIQSAAQRSHADADLVKLFSSSLVQMHGLPASAAPQAFMPPALEAQAAPLLSGLADFEASFSGSFSRSNSRGFETEKGHTQLQIGQRTQSNYHANSGSLDLAQTVHTQLDATIQKALLPDGLLDTESGNYEIQRIHDLHTSLTQLAAKDGQLTQATQTQNNQQSLTVQKFMEHKLVEQYERPHQEQLLRQLLP